MNAFAKNSFLRAAFRMLLFVVCSIALPIAGAQNKDEGARPEIGKPLQAAQELLKARKPQDALAKIREAENVSNKTEYETYIVNRVRINAALAAGDVDLAVRSFEAAMKSGRLTSGEQLAIDQALTGAYYKAKDYAKVASWAQRYFKDGGTDAQMRTLLVQSYYLGGDYAEAARSVQIDIQAEEKAGRAPAEEQLQLLANAYLKQNDRAGYAATIEKLVAYHPKKQYWTDAIRHVEAQSGFADRLALDLYRLKLAVGVASAADYVEATQLALRDGFPIEAKKIIDSGFASGALGSGEHAGRQARLRDVATKSAAEDQKTLNKNIADAAKAKDGDVLLNVGFAAVGNGQFDEGIRLMERGVEAGNSKQPENAKLHLGIAYLQAGQKSKAIQAFKTVRGDDGSAALARLWTMHAQHASK